MSHLLRFRAIALLAPMLLSPVALPGATTAQTVNIAQLQTNLQAAICANDWNQALRAINPLIGSPGISNAYRQELIQFRVHLQDWRAARVEFTNFPNCAGVIPIRQPGRSQPSSRPLDWQRAIQNIEDATSQPSPWIFP